MSCAPPDPPPSHPSSGNTMLSVATPHHQDIYHHHHHHGYPEDQVQQRLPVLPPPHPHLASLPLPLPVPQPILPHHYQQQQQQQPQLQHADPSSEPHVFYHSNHRLPMPHRISTPPPQTSRVVFPSQDVAAVRQALEMARESPDGASDPTICKILEVAITGVWDKVRDQPESYVMDRDEFAVFNYFQHRFRGDAVAVAARKRYWDHLHA